jgi:hypothetical protein
MSRVWFRLPKEGGPTPFILRKSQLSRKFSFCLPAGIPSAGGLECKWRLYRTRNKETKCCRAHPVEGERVGICKTVHVVLDLEQFACSSFVLSLLVCRPCFANCRWAPPHSHRWGYAGRCCCCLRSVHIECLLRLEAPVLACPHLDGAGGSLLGLWINHLSMEKRPLSTFRSMPTLEIMSEFQYIQFSEAV